MKKIFTLVFIIITVSTGYSQQGESHNFSVFVNNLYRSYKLYVPPGHDGSEAWPVVFLFHGHDTPVDTQIDVSQMYLVADTAKFFIVYPHGRTTLDTIANLMQKGWLVPGYELVGTPYSDVEFVEEMIKDIHDKPDFSIDTSRVYSSGWSNGSEMSFYLACTLGDKIAAVAGVAAPMS